MVAKSVTSLVESSTKTAGQWSAASTSYATYLNTTPTAQSRAAANMMYGQALVATEIGFGANIVEQMFRPNVGKVVTDLTIDVGSKWVSDKNLVLSYPINEMGEQFKNSNTVQILQQKINDGYINLINKVSKGGPTK